ncbi:MAG TPA: DUF2231 domain-containing protein [Terriglobales bacterium]|nr:DUF2231 domain-containing protein [Terriglobales bacterium]
MPRVTVGGHALHPQLVGLPIGMLPFSAVMDTLYAITDNEAFGKAAHYAMVGGVTTALAAGAAGALDYLAVEKNTTEKKLANVHGLMNLALVALTAFGLSMRRRGLPKSKPLAVVIGVAGTAGLVVSQWYGGQMVYEHGLRVKGKGELEGVREFKPSWDEKAEKALHSVADEMPGSGPTERVA